MEMVSPQRAHDERIARMVAHDQALCQRCPHKGISHGAFDHTGRFVGIGLGMCGAEGSHHDLCPCHAFQATVLVGTS